MDWKLENKKWVEILESYDASSYSIEIVEYYGQCRVMLKIDRNVGLPLIFIGYTAEEAWMEAER